MIRHKLLCLEAPVPLWCWWCSTAQCTARTTYPEQHLLCNEHLLCIQAVAHATPGQDDGISFFKDLLVVTQTLLVFNLSNQLCLLHANPAAHDNLRQCVDMHRDWRTSIAVTPCSRAESQQLWIELFIIHGFCMSSVNILSTALHATCTVPVCVSLTC